MGVQGTESWSQVIVSLVVAVVFAMIGSLAVFYFTGKRRDTKRIALKALACVIFICGVAASALVLPHLVLKLLHIHNAVSERAAVYSYAGLWAAAVLRYFRKNGS